MEEILGKDFGIAKYFSYVVLKTPVNKLHYPLPVDVPRTLSELP